MQKLKAKKKSKEKRRTKHHKTSLKKVLVQDITKPNGVLQNPFIVKSRVISKRVSSVIIGIQQPIIQMLNLDSETWFKQWCDPVGKRIVLEVYNSDEYDKSKSKGNDGDDNKNGN